MTPYERSAWIMLITSIPAYLAYVIIVLTSAGDRPLAEADYVWPALIVIAATIVANIVLGIIAQIARPKENRVDERDRLIERIGDRVGNSFLVIGGVAAMLMAMFEWHTFWIANTLFLGFFLSGIVGSIAKVSIYRGGMP